VVVGSLAGLVLSSFLLHDIQVEAMRISESPVQVFIAFAPVTKIFPSCDRSLSARLEGIQVKSETIIQFFRA
jgi:hypothetical protein